MLLTSIFCLLPVMQVLRVSLAKEAAEKDSLKAEVDAVTSNVNRP